MKLVVMGISGITGGGKTTLATNLHEFLSDPKNTNIFHGLHINKVVVMNQDKYFYARDSPHHKWIPEINFINREILSAMDMDRFADDVRTNVDTLKMDSRSNDVSTIMNKDDRLIEVNILIIEGFLMYNDERINKYCQLRFHIYLSFNVGLERRFKRTFKHVNPNPEWYYENYIWPNYNKHLNEVPNKSDFIYLNGEQKIEDIFHQARDYIEAFLTK